MASTDVLITSNDSRTVTPDALTFTSGDTVSISAAEDAPSLLAFSPATQAILDPAPDAQLIIDAGQTYTFTFTSDAPGTYTVAVAEAGFDGSLDAPDGGASDQGADGSTAQLNFEVVAMKPSSPPPPAPPPPLSQTGPSFHPNSGG